MSPFYKSSIQSEHGNDPDHGNQRGKDSTQPSAQPEISPSGHMGNSPLGSEEQIKAFIKVGKDASWPAWMTDVPNPPLTTATSGHISVTPESFRATAT